MNQLSDIHLPITEVIPAIKKTLAKENRLIISAPPGAGKSTLLPISLIYEIWLGNKKIILLEPRRLAAKTIALRMAELLNEDVGKTVGYRIRFETKISTETKLEVVTEGILTRMLQSDNALENVGLVIFDEFHERSLHADLALALCREAQEILRPDLKLLVMSATLNIPKLKETLNAEVIESKGKLFPVDLIYAGDADVKLLPELTARLVVEAVSKHEGDALVFLPGEAEIKKCAELLENQVHEFSIHPLYGMLPPREQFLAILPNKKGKRKIVIATSIAETSLTIEGIKIVIDCGFTKQNVFDIKSGLSKLETVKITNDAADQRAGRAGRLSEGVCYRMWSFASQQRISHHRIPEIEQSDLSALQLELYKWGVNNAYSLNWISPPPKANIQQSKELLEQIGAIENDKITEHGKKIHALACHPRIANMLLSSTDESSKQLATDIAAILEERDPFPRESGVDLNLRIETLRRNRERKGLNPKFLRIEKNASFYRKLIQVSESNSIVDAYETGLLLSYAYPERIASAKPGNNAQFMLANGKIAMFNHQDELAHESWICIANMDLRDGMGKIFLAAPLQPKDLKSLVKEKETVSWDSRKGGLISSKELRIGSLVLQSKPIANPDKHLIKAAICKVIQQEGELLLDFNDKTEQFFNRLSSFLIWNPDESASINTKQQFLQNPENWIDNYIEDIKRNDDLKKISIQEAFENSLDWELKTRINKLIPEKIEVPSGSKIPITYFSNGSQPHLSVRLQELFGMNESPSINNGKIKLVLNLLSPGYKPVQVTSDLISFWNHAYHEVKKELQRRYPKHSWPENPFEAKAVAKGKSWK
jgi:ATP-dependent helicase HrpB